MIIDEILRCLRDRELVYFIFQADGKPTVVNGVITQVKLAYNKDVLVEIRNEPHIVTRVGAEVYGRISDALKAAISSWNNQKREAIEGVSEQYQQYFEVLQDKLKIAKENEGWEKQI